MNPTRCFLNCLSIGIAFSVCIPSRSQQVQVTPNPAPLDAKLTVNGAGFPPGLAVSVFWDQPQPPSLQSNIFLFNAPTPNASGAFSFTLAPPSAQVYPASAGQHTLSVIWVDTSTFNYRTLNVPVILTPRQGWAAPPALPTQGQNGLAAGTLAYLRYSADGASTSLILSDGQSEHVLGTAAASALEFGQPDWSPDGSRIAFNTVFDTFPHQNLYVLDTATGTLQQATNLGGTPPRLAGGGTGSLTGAILPYIQPLPPSQLPDPGEDHCNGMVQGSFNPQTGQLTRALFPLFPKGGFATLVGTGIVVTAPLTTGGKDGDPFPFRFDNLPEGDYSLHMWHNETICKEVSRPNPKANQGDGDKPRLTVWEQAAAVPSLTVPVHITAGKVNALEPLRMVEGYTSAQSASWLTDTSLLYTLASGTYLVGDGAALLDVYSVVAGQSPVQITDSAQSGIGLISDTDASPPNRLFIANSQNATGLIYSDPGFTSVSYLSSWKAVLSATGGTVILDRSPSWDPIGSHIAFIRELTLSNLLVGDIWTQEVATGIERRLTGFNLAAGEGAYGRPAWSPDRSQLAFSYTTDNMKTTNIRVINVANGSSFNLTTDGHSALPAWAAARPLTGFPANLDLQPRLPAATVKPGDLNGDGKVTITDAILALQFTVGLGQPSTGQILAGDLNQDSKITLPDVIGILRLSIGL